MQEEALDEGLGRQGQRSLGVLLRGSAHPEPNLVIIDPDDALVRDRHAMRIAAPRYSSTCAGPPSGCFAHTPTMVMKPRQQCLPGSRVKNCGGGQLAVLSFRLERRHELAAKHPGERLHRKQKAAPARPPFARYRQRPAGDQRMDMHMPPQILLPGMQHQREGRRAAQPARVGGSTSVNVADTAPNRVS